MVPVSAFAGCAGMCKHVGVQAQKLCPHCQGSGVFTKGCEDCQSHHHPDAVHLWIALMPVKRPAPLRHAQHFCHHHLSQPCPSTGDIRVWQAVPLPDYKTQAREDLEWDLMPSWCAKSQIYFCWRISLSTLIKPICWSIGVSIFHCSLAAHIHCDWLVQTARSEQIVVIACKYFTSKLLPVQEYPRANHRYGT